MSSTTKRELETELTNSFTDDVKKKLIEEIKSQLMIDLTEEIKKQVIEVINANNMTALSPNYDGLDIEAKEEENVQPISSDIWVSSQITYEEALDELGGSENIARFKTLSDDLQASVGDEILDNEIKKMFPPSMKKVSVSKKMIKQAYVKNINDLYIKAEAIHEKFNDMVNHIANETSSIAILPLLKGKDRATNKANFKYRDQGGEGVAYYRLTDIVRGTLEFSDIHKMYDGLRKVMEYFNVKEFNDRYQEPKPDGYRDLQLVVKVDNFMCELKLSTEVMRNAKESSGHRNYDVSMELEFAVRERDLGHVIAALKFGHDQLGSKVTRDFMVDKYMRFLPHEAAKLGEVDTLNCLLENGANVDAQDDAGDTLLHHAVYNGHDRCAWMLLSKFNCLTNVRNRENETAVIKGYLMLYDGSSTESSRRVMVTILQMVGVEQVKDAIKIKDETVKKQLYNSRLLVEHSLDGNLEKMRELLELYANPKSSRDRMTALQAAVRNGHQKAVELLIKFNVLQNENDSDILIVQEALDLGHIEITEILRDSGASCNGTTWNLLVEFATDGNEEKMKNLLILDINPDSSQDGVTALQAAVRGGYLGAVEILLHYKASTADCIGETPIVQEAIEFGSMELVRLLIKSGASCRNVAPIQHVIPNDINGHRGNDYLKWNGIVEYNRKLFCAPCNASLVLVMDEWI